MGDSVSEVFADIIYESATLGPTGIDFPGNSINSGQYLGSRFSITQQVEVSEIGGHLRTQTGNIFGAIVELSGPLPSSFPLSAGEVVASTVISAPGLSSDVSVPLSVTLMPGDYAIIFGSGQFGATGFGLMTFNNVNTPEGVGSYFFSQAGNWLNGGFDNTRFTVNGVIAIPSPTIKITKDTTNGDGSFDFTIFNATNPANSTALNIPDTSINNMTAPLTIQAASFSVIETVPLNWNLISSDCLINGIPHGSTLNFNLINGDTVECIFENLFVPPPLPPRTAVGGELIPLDSTMILVAGAQYSAAWMIPAIVSAIGIGIVIARKF